MPITPEDMQAYKDLNNELPDPYHEDQVRGPERCPVSKKQASKEWHGHVGPVHNIAISCPASGAS